MYHSSEHRLFSDVLLFLLTYTLAHTKTEVKKHTLGNFYKIIFDLLPIGSDSKEESDCRPTAFSIDPKQAFCAAAATEQLNKLESARNKQNIIQQTRRAVKCFTTPR